MILIDLPTSLEKHFIDVVQDNYDGNLQAAIAAFLKLHEKYGMTCFLSSEDAKNKNWKEQLLEDVKSVRSEVRRKGGIKAEAIDNAIKKYRQGIGSCCERYFTCCD